MRPREFLNIIFETCETKSTMALSRCHRCSWANRCSKQRLSPLLKSFGRLPLFCYNFQCYNIFSSHHVLWMYATSAPIAFRWSKNLIGLKSQTKHRRLKGTTPDQKSHACGLTKSATASNHIRTSGWGLFITKTVHILLVLCNCSSPPSPLFLALLYFK